MYGAIFGFQRLALCPKCAPALSRSLALTIGMQNPFPERRAVRAFLCGSYGFGTVRAVRERFRAIARTNSTPTRQTHG
ncbi:MAG: hypothetical protein AMXMBFR7_41440 [Planctomycetota bacterium]